VRLGYFADYESCDLHALFSHLGWVVPEALLKRVLSLVVHLRVSTIVDVFNVFLTSRVFICFGKLGR